jgi:copper chaperone CopZ
LEVLTFLSTLPGNASTVITEEKKSVETKTFKVPNMTCNGCVSTVRSEIEQIAGTEVLEINKPAQLVTVSWQAPASWELIESRLTEIEYPPVEE